IARGTRLGRYINGGRLTARVVTQCGNRSQQLAAVPERNYAKLLEVLGREVRQDRLIYLVFAECPLVFPEAKAPQPDHNVHYNAATGWRISAAGEARVSRAGWVGQESIAYGAGF